MKEVKTVIRLLAWPLELWLENTAWLRVSKHWENPVPKQSESMKSSYTAVRRTKGTLCLLTMGCYFFTTAFMLFDSSPEQQQFGFEYHSSNLMLSSD